MELNYAFQQKNQDNMYQNNISLNARQQESALIDNNFHKARNGVNTCIIPRNFNQNILNQTDKFKPIEQLQDIEEHKQSFVVSNLSGQKMNP